MGGGWHGWQGLIRCGEAYGGSALTVGTRKKEKTYGGISVRY